MSGRRWWFGRWSKAARGAARDQREQIRRKPPLYIGSRSGFGADGGVSELSVACPRSIGLPWRRPAFRRGSRRVRGRRGDGRSGRLATSPEWAKWPTTARTDATFALCLTAAFSSASAGCGAVADRLSRLAIAAGPRPGEGFLRRRPRAIVVFVEIWAAWGMGGDYSAGRPPPACRCRRSPFSQRSESRLRLVQSRIIARTSALSPLRGGWTEPAALGFSSGCDAFTGMLPWSVLLRAPFGVRPRPIDGDEAEVGFSRYLVLDCHRLPRLHRGAESGRTYLLPLYPAAALADRPRARSNPSSGGIGARVRATGRGLDGSGDLPAGGGRPHPLASRNRALATVVPWLHPAGQVLVPQCGTESVHRRSPRSSFIARWQPRSGPPPLQGVAVSLPAWSRVARHHTVVGCAYLPQLEARPQNPLHLHRRVAARVGAEPLAFYRVARSVGAFYLKRHVPVERGSFAALQRRDGRRLAERNWEALPRRSAPPRKSSIRARRRSEAGEPPARSDVSGQETALGL